MSDRTEIKQAETSGEATRQPQSAIQLRLIDGRSQSAASLLQQIASRGKMTDPAVTKIVTDILAAVRERGDEAVLAYTHKLDGADLAEARELEISRLELEQARQRLEPQLLQDLEQAAANIRRFHEAQMEDMQDTLYEPGPGQKLALRNRPLAQVGVYVPGGTAPLPSSVLMNVIPAKTAGVPRVVMCTPPGPDGRVADVILAAALIAGADRVFRIGGAQAIAAMAYGTTVVPQVDKICGPGNIYVNTAKRMVYGTCDIDMFAGPSEILIIADNSAPAAFVAADMLSQAEHDRMASAIVLTDDPALAQDVCQQAKTRAEAALRKGILERSLTDYSAVILLDSLEEACRLANSFAPEHLELAVRPEREIALLNRITNAGAVFLGLYSPEPLGDYWAGANHVLPTSGSARFFSPLNCSDFIKKMSVIRYDRPALQQASRAIETLARAEGLTCHAESIAVRFEASQALNRTDAADASANDLPLTPVTPAARLSRYASPLCAALKPYVPGEQPRDRRYIKLNTNENPYGPGVAVAQAAARFDPDTLRLYPDPDCLELRKALAAYYGLDIECVFCGNGSDEILAMAFAAFFADRGKARTPVVLPELSYSFYPVFARFWDLPVTTVPLDPDFRIDWQGMLEEAGQGLVLANPNAPTGQALSEAQLDQLLRQAWELKRMVIIDEAYIDFGGCSAVPWIKQYDNLLVVQTFSKSRSLAGLRLGFALGQPDLITALCRIRDSFNSYTVDRQAQALGLAALQDGEQFARTTAKVVRTRQAFQQACQARGWQLLPSQTNFVLLGLPGKSGLDIYRQLKQKGILVRYFDDSKLRPFVRITIGTDEEIARLLAALDVLADQ